MSARKQYKHVVQEHKIEMDWLKGTKDLYMQYLVNSFYLCNLIAEENDEEIERVNQKMVQKIKKEDKSQFILSLDDEHKEYLMEKKGKTFGKTLTRRLQIQKMVMVQQKDSKGKNVPKEYPNPLSLQIEIKDDKSKNWLKDATNQNARMTITFEKRKPIVAYFDDKHDAHKIRDAFISKQITSQLNLLEALKASQTKLINDAVTKFKAQLGLYAEHLKKNAIEIKDLNGSGENDDSVPQENEDSEERPAKKSKQYNPDDNIDSDEDNEKDKDDQKNYYQDLSQSMKQGVNDFKDADDEELEAVLEKFDQEKIFSRDEREKRGSLDFYFPQEQDQKQAIVSNINIQMDDDPKPQLKLDTNVNNANQYDKNNQLTIDIDTRPTKVERPKDINAESITQQVNEKYTKFCRNLILEHAIEELNHVSQENHPMKMVGILKQTILKLKEGVKVIMFICNERKNMVSLIENQQDLIERQINEMNQMNLSSKLSQMDENFFKNQLLLLNNYLKQFYHFVQNCQKSIEILEQIFKYDPEWRQDIRYKNQNILNDIEELPKHCFKIIQFHNDKLKEVKKLYDNIVKSDENDNKYIEYTQAEIKQTVDLLKPLSEHFELNSTIEFEILFFLFIEDVKLLNDKFQTSFNKQQENINGFKKSYEDIRNFYYQRLQKILELKYQNNITKQKLMKITIPTNSKINNEILKEGIESRKQVNQQLQLIKDQLSQPLSEGAYFQQIKNYEDLKAQEIISEFENEISNLKQIFEVVNQIEAMEQTVEKLAKLRDTFDNDEITEDDSELQQKEYKKLIQVVEKHSKDMECLVDISPAFKAFHSKLISEIQLSNVVLEVINFS